MADAKVDIISQGAAWLKKKKTSKLCQAVWNAVTSMERCVLTPPDGNFYFLLSGFKAKYADIPVTQKAQTFKDDLFDYIVQNIDYTRVIMCIE